MIVTVAQLGMLQLGTLVSLGSSVRVIAVFSITPWLKDAEMQGLMHCTRDTITSCPQSRRLYLCQFPERNAGQFIAAFVSLVPLPHYSVISPRADAKRLHIPHRNWNSANVCPWVILHSKVGINFCHYFVSKLKVDWVH